MACIPKWIIRSQSKASPTGRGGPIHLINEGKDRDAPLTAHIKQLARLGLNAFGRIRAPLQRYRWRPGCGSIFGEVFVAGGIQQH